MSHLIDDLLDFSRAERVDLQKGSVALEELVHEVRQGLRHLTNGREIVWTVGPLPQVHADRAILRVAIVNLLSNAIKFSRGRTPAQIEVQGITRNNEVVVSVRDNGVGFDMQQAGKLFGVFERLHAKNEFEGNGIGLASVQRIIQRHGGRTWAESSIGNGATFWFSLPANPDSADREHGPDLLDRQDWRATALQTGSDRL
ncbi:MAG: GHKL domain-containing protein [Acidimicrobiia bacterium]|nr:GHKL domain-containing protein [Acidimicrobiia bacterium]